MSGQYKDIATIIAQIPTLELFQSIVLRIASNQAEVVVGEIGNTGSCLLVSSLKNKLATGCIWIFTDIKQFTTYANLLDAIGTRYVTLTDSHNISGCLAHIRAGGIVLATVEQVLRPVEPLSIYREKSIQLVVEEKVTYDLEEQFIQLGYERVKTVDSPGQFSRRGDVLDFWSELGPVRVSFLGFAVEQITVLEAGKKDIASVTVQPYQVQNGSDFLLTYFTGTHFIFQGKDTIAGQIIKYVQSFRDELSSDNLTQLASLQAFLKDEQKIYLESFTAQEKNSSNLGWFRPKTYARNTQDLIKDLRRTVDQGRAVVISSPNPERFEKLLTHNNLAHIQGIELLTSTVSEGVVLPQLGITLLTEAEILGEERTASKTRKKGLDFSAITNLKVGEFVVHIDHGIGRFVGFGQVAVDGVTREYIFIEYSGEDKIYCPLDQADKITKYITAGNTEPKLSHLASGAWEKIRSKVKADVELIAKELLEIQAMREKTKPFTYTQDGSEQLQVADSFQHITTPDQQRAITEVLASMMDTKPMDRLLCGDVGYGKTEVAVRAALRAVVSGGQVAFLVPTTILAEQHVQTLEARLGQFGVRIASLSRFVSTHEQKKALELLRAGSLDIIVGTHRLLSADVSFKNLMLVIIDEEQKFGVRHKEKLKQLRAGVDVLTMTATPIPRTLYLGLGGLKDISLIQTPPEGRLPIKTMVVKKSDEVITAAIRQELSRGGQIYIVHNRVETIQAFAQYVAGLVPELTYKIAHGQMGEGQLAGIINEFAAGEFKALVCSTIIESGLDISTVNTMIVDRATHFGLSQLHQLRGRIGRGSVQAFAYFLYSEKELVGDAQKRLTSILSKGDLGSGYELSLEDLDIRGSGNILGRDQHGSMQMVGVGYYMKLLEEAVERMQSHKTPEEVVREVKIDLPISAYIPENFYKTEEQKIKAYQVLASLEDTDEVLNFRSREEQIHGELPVEYQALLATVGLKLRARSVGITSITTQDVPTIDAYKKKRIVIAFDHELSNSEKAELFSTNSGWMIKSREAKIDLQLLGESWFGKIKTALEFLAHLQQT
ncbi:MAG: transcription-repair coupling factor [Patescibacteria group bacterium]